METPKIKDFNTLIATLQKFWANHGCAIVQPYPVEVGAGTFHPLTVFGSLSSKPESYAYVQGCSRPADGRYGDNPNRLQFYYQFQVMLKPGPKNVLELYYESLKTLGINKEDHDIRLVEDDWESPSLSAFGMGWEIWCDGMEITQFTYFQQVGGIEPKLAPVEITYGLERLAMYILGKDNVYDLPWCIKEDGSVTTYGDLYLQSEREFCSYNFEQANTDRLTKDFDNLEQETNDLIEKGLPLPAYHLAAKSSHTFNLLEARGVVSKNSKTAYIQRIQRLVKKCCALYVEKEQGQ